MEGLSLNEFDFEKRVNSWSELKNLLWLDWGMATISGCGFGVGLTVPLYFFSWGKLCVCGMGDIPHPIVKALP